ncbi:PGM/PMM family protein [Salmonella enterica subsp. enterica]|uniref:PGM/PMM family protein n=1 Tax=Salmonella enterica I TaxID=59201 RepID=A0A447TUP7_SALET|nr:PGM/PMM family protein [Salmonella enterica subsp. enterica]
MVRNHMSLHDLCSGMKMFPQILVNVRYTAGSGDPLENEAVKAVTADVGSHARQSWGGYCYVNPVTETR